MIQNLSMLNVIDNSGAKLVQCIKVLNRKNYGTLGDIILVSVRKSNFNKKVKKGMVYKALIVQLKKKIQRFDGISVSFNKNAVVLLSNTFVPIGSRILEPVSLELNTTKRFLKVLTLAPLIV